MRNAYLSCSHKIDKEIYDLQDLFSFNKCGLSSHKHCVTFVKNGNISFFKVIYYFKLDLECIICIIIIRMLSFFLVTSKYVFGTMIIHNFVLFLYWKGHIDNLSPSLRTKYMLTSTTVVDGLSELASVSHTCTNIVYLI